MNKFALACLLSVTNTQYSDWTAITTDDTYTDTTTNGTANATEPVELWTTSEDIFSAATVPPMIYWDQGFYGWQEILELNTPPGSYIERLTWCQNDFAQTINVGSKTCAWGVDGVPDVLLGNPYSFTEYDCQSIAMGSDGECIIDGGESES